MANRRYQQFYYSLHKYPVELDCRFQVDPTNVNGLGISNLSGPGIAAVYMNTSATPAATNPNPASGIILVQFQDNYNKYNFGGSQFRSPLTGTNINLTDGTMTIGRAYVITSVGTSTTANWVAVGVPVGTTPAVGVPFIASATTGVGTGVVQLPVTSGEYNIEVVGDPQLTIGSSAAMVLGVSSGSYMILQCVGPTSSGSTVSVARTPVALSWIFLNFFMGNSSILIQGG
jgi:hypothetical protein